MSKQVLGRIPVDKIDTPVANPRFEPRDLDDLVQSIKGVGILEPLICVVSTPGRVRLVCGLRRFTAATIAGLKEVPAVVHAAMSDQQELAISLVENLHRKDLSPVERGEAFVKLHDSGLTYRAVAQMVGLSHLTVATSVAIATRLIPEAQDACHRGDLTQAQAWELSKQPVELQRAMFLGERLQRPKRIGGPGRRSKAESALRSALAAINQGRPDVALECAEEAVAELRKRQKIRAVS